MANAKRKCCGCKERFPHEEMISLPVGYFHSVSCSIEYANKKQVANSKKAAAKVKKAHAKQKREHYDNHIPTRKNAAKAACHLYIRMRDRNQPCICCGKPLGSDYQAGHFLPSGSNTKIRYHEDNIHAQRLDCNYFKGGDNGEYKERLTAKIGSERVEYLLNNKGGVMNRTASDYKAIETHYKQKLKELAGIE